MFEVRGLFSMCGLSFLITLTMYIHYDNVILKHNFDTDRSFKIFNILQNNLPNVPVLSWLARVNTTMKNKANCSIFPSILEIEYSNRYWQIFHSYDATYHLYGA